MPIPTPASAATSAIVTRRSAAGDGGPWNRSTSARCRPRSALCRPRPARRALRVPAGPASALAQPQRGRHHLAGLLAGPVVELPQRSGHHLTGDVVDRDGHGGQPRVHQDGRGAAVEAGDREVLAERSPNSAATLYTTPASLRCSSRWRQASARGGPRTAATESSRARWRRPPAACLPGRRKPRWPPARPCTRRSVRRPVTQRPVADVGDPPVASGQQVLHGRGDGSACCRCRPSSAAAPGRSGRSRRTASALRPAASPARRRAAARRAGTRPRSGWRSAGASRPWGPLPGPRPPGCSSVVRTPPPATAGTAA